MEVVFLILLAGFCLLGLKTFKILKEMSGLLERVNGEICSLRLFIEKNMPVSMDDMSMTELAKEVKRRELFLGKVLEMLKDAVAAGIGKAFKK